MNKTLKIVLGLFAAMILLTGGFAGGFVTGHLVTFGAPQSPVSDTAVPPALPTTTTDQQSATPSELQTLFTPFWEAWNLVHKEYVNQPVDDIKLMQGAIKGMMESLGDKHSSYMDPQTYEAVSVELSGSYEGIGAYVDPTAPDYLTIISPIEGSPAEKAGLLPGDKIIKINGEDMTGVDPELARRKVLGPAGTDVTLTISRKDEPTFDVTITRQQIVIKSATGKMLDNGIAYVQITTYGENTTAELKSTLQDLMAQNPKGLILDLRNNGGGFLTTAVEVVSQFVPQGVALYEKFGDGKQNQYDVIPGGLATQIPMVVLINEGTASASEITAGALQDYGRAKLVGVVSYGKGSVQNWVPLSNDQGAVRVTIAKWYTPKNRTIEGVGLTPDVYVTMTADDYKAQRDPQLDAAVETMLAVLNNTVIPTSIPTPVSTPTP